VAAVPRRRSGHFHLIFLKIVFGGVSSDIAPRRIGPGGHSFSKRLDAPYRSGPCRTWLKSKNPASEAVQREREEDWG
jgi:hypothetical protein